MKTWFRACAKCTCSDHPAHAQIISRVFAFRSYIFHSSIMLLADSEGPCQTLSLHLHCQHMPKDTFLYGMAHTVLWDPHGLIISFPLHHENNFDPLKPHFYIVKLGFTGVYIIFLIFAQTHRFWVLIRTASPRRF